MIIEKCYIDRCNDILNDINNSQINEISKKKLIFKDHVLLLHFDGSDAYNVGLDYCRKGGKIYAIHRRKRN